MPEKGYINDVTGRKIVDGVELYEIRWWESKEAIKNGGHDAQWVDGGPLRSLGGDSKAMVKEYDEAHPRGEGDVVSREVFDSEILSATRRTL